LTLDFSVSGFCFIFNYQIKTKYEQNMNKNRIQEKATEEILRLTNEIVKSHPSGEKFFDSLDEQLSDTRNRWLITAGLSLIPKNHTLILSGGFGKTVAELIDSGWLGNRKYVLFRGGIRKGSTPIILRHTKDFNKNSTFFDDSIYGGATFYAIKNFIEKNTSIPSPKKCISIYDGCPQRRKEVKSLFRYYDFFSATPNFQF
jgi:hypothetical protein